MVSEDRGRHGGQEAIEPVAQVQGAARETESFAAPGGEQLGAAGAALRHQDAAQYDRVAELQKEPAIDITVEERLAQSLKTATGGITPLPEVSLDAMPVETVMQPVPPPEIPPAKPKPHMRMAEFFGIDD